MIRSALLVALLVACHHHRHVRGPVPPTHPHPASDGWIGYVDPFIGTDDGDSPDPPPGDTNGATYPGATVPFGMIQWSPDTAPSAEFGYHYRDDHLRGFSVTHLSGTGCPAMLDFPFLPATIAPSGTRSVAEVRRAATFHHADEIALPGYYRVTLGTGIEVELTARLRAGYARIASPANAGLLIEAGKTVEDDAASVTSGELHVISPTRITAALTSERFCGHASRYRIYLAAMFDHPIAQTASWRQDAWTPGARDVRGPRSGMWLGFDTKTIGVTIAISYVSAANAVANLDAALADGAGFDQVRAEAARTWNEALGHVEVRGGGAHELRTFYTALYHSLLDPNVASDVNGDYAGFDGEVHRAVGYTHYQTFSGWDIYRSWIQLVTLLYPKEGDDIVRSLVEDGQACGGLPRWALANDETGVMVGDPGALIVANAYAFGARAFDARAALALATRSGARCNLWPTRPREELANELGFLPNDPEGGWGSAAVTLEYAVADYAIAQLARSLGEADLADAYTRRSTRWRNLFDPVSGFIRPRHGDGGWKAPFRPTHQRGFIEGNAAQYTFFVPQDPTGLAAALGGNARTIARLDALFTQLNSGLSFPHFYIGNEPQFGTPYLYDHLGAPEKTQEVVRRIITRTFTDLPSGLPGNDDLGALSSWYVWAALGLYPDVPGTATLAIASPLFPHVALHLRDGSTLSIEAPNAAPGAPIVDRLELDGAAIEPTAIPLARLLGGHRLVFALRP